MSNYTRWYTTGNVNVTNGSKAVTGSGTYWNSAGLNPGDMLTLDNGNSFKEIASINGDTSITLAANYSGATATNADYAIVRNFTATTPAKTAAMAAELMGDFQKYIDTDMQKLNGKSAYEIAKENGYSGTEAQWLESLKGEGAEALRNELAGILTSNGRNGLFRYRYDLGASFTQAQATEISSGTFNGLYLGARWLKNITYYRIIGFNHFSIVQDYQNPWIAPGNHIVVEMYKYSGGCGVFDTDNKYKTGGLTAADIYTQVMPTYLAEAETFFGADHIQPLYAKVCDALTDNKPSHFTLSTDKIFMFTPSQILGCGTYDNAALYLNFRRQFPYFRFKMPTHSDETNANQYWLAASNPVPYYTAHNMDELKYDGTALSSRQYKFYLVIK